MPTASMPTDLSEAGGLQDLAHSLPAKFQLHARPYPTSVMKVNEMAQAQSSYLLPIRIAALLKDPI